MERVVSKTVDALSRFGERIERRLSTGGDDEHPAYESGYEHGYQHSGSGSMFGGSGSAFHRPLEKSHDKKSYYSSKKRDLAYGGKGKHSADHLAASPSGSSSFSNYRQNPIDRASRPPYGTGIGGPLNYGQQGGFANAAYGGGAYGNAAYGNASFGNAAYGNAAYGGGGGAYGEGAYGANIGYAPDYYIAERRQLELVPAPPPRIIQQKVPVPVPVDRPVPQPYPVHVPQPVPVDRPYPVHVPHPVPVDRPVPVPVPVPVPSPPPPPVQVPVPVPVAVPTPVPCYIPVGVPVPSPPPSPCMVENSVTYKQRWITGSPVMMQEQRQLAGSPVMMNQQRYLAGSPVMGMNPCSPYGQGAYMG